MKNTSHYPSKPKTTWRKTILFALLAATLFTMKPGKVNAQWTAVSTTVWGSPITACSAPDSLAWSVAGNLTGTAVPGDSCTIYINWGDGTDQAVKVADSTLVYYTFGHNYTIPGTFTAFASVTTATGLTNGWVSPTPSIIAASCATVSGHLYVDNNHNCVHDAGEPPVSNMPIYIINTALLDTILAGYSDDSGFYSIEVPTGGYTILANATYAYSTYWGYLGATPTGDVAPSCPANGTYSLTVAAGATYTQDFADTCSPLTSFDQAVEGDMSGHFFPGDTGYVRIFAGNAFWFYDYTCASLTSTVTLTLDPHLHYAGYCSIPPTSIVGNTLTWNAATLTGGYYSFYPLVKVSTDVSATLGTILTCTVSATPTSYPDPDMSNNTRTFTDIVAASFDPNIISVCPQGVGAQGYITNNTMLTYSIHFQNTGTAAARNITVDDTLSAHLDVRTLHILASSSPVKLYNDGNALRFRFENINLPDSTSNPDGSIGSVTYSVMPKSGLAPGTQIFNSANIFFDYNPGVATNKALNTIKNNLAVAETHTSINTVVYPNPAENKLFVSTGTKTDFTVTVMDMSGRTIYTGSGYNGIAEINTTPFTSGIYLIKVIDASGVAQTSKAVVQH